MPARKRLGQLLVDLKIIDEHQLQSALGHQKQWGGKLGGILVQKGFCREEQVLAALSQHLAMPAVRLGEVKADPRAVKTIARSVAEKLHVFAYEISGSGRHEVVSVAMSDPTDLSAIDQLAFHTGKRIKPMLAGDSDVALAIQQHYAEAAKPAPAAAPRPTPTATHNPFATASGEPPPPPPAAAPAAAQRTGTPAAGTPRAAAPAPASDPAPAEAQGGDAAADARMEGLEPIAAHSQPPQGDDSLQLEDPTALQGWTEQPQEQAAEWTDAGSAPAVDQLPADAIVGEAPAAEAQAQAPDGWQDDADPLAAGAADDWGNAEPAAPAADPVSDEADVEVTFDEASVSEPDAPAAEPASASHDEDQLLAEVHAAAESYAAAAADDPGESAPAAEADAPAQEQSEAPSVADAPAEPAAEDAGAFAFEEAAPPQESAPANDGDSFVVEEQVAGAASSADGADVAPPEQAANGEAPADSDVGAFAFEEPAGSFAIEEQPASAPEDQPAPAAEEQPAFAAEDQRAEEPSGFAAEDAPASEPAGEQPAIATEEQPAEEPGTHALEDAAAPDASSAQPDGFWQQPGGDAGHSIEQTMRLRFAVPTPDEYAESEAQSGEAWPTPAEGEWFGEAGALSAADLGTLQSLGIDPGDPAAALRQIAALVRVLHRRQLIDLDELAAEVRDASPAEQPPAGTPDDGGPENRWPET